MISVNDRQDRCPGIEIPESVSYFSAEGHRFILPLVMVGVKKLINLQKTDVELNEVLFDKMNKVKARGMVYDLTMLRPDFKHYIADQKYSGDVIIIPEEESEEFWGQSTIPVYKEYYTFLKSGIHFCSEPKKFKMPECDEAVSIRPYVKDLLMVYFIVNRNIRHDNNTMLSYELFKMGITGNMIDNLTQFFGRYKDFESTVEGILDDGT